MIPYPLVESLGPCYNDPMAPTTDERRNFLTLLIDAAGYPLGMSFLSTQVILPGFLGEMGANNLLIGLVPALANLGLFLPPVFMAAWTERRRYVRLPLFYLAIWNVCPWPCWGLPPGGGAGRTPLFSCRCSSSVGDGITWSPV